MTADEPALERLEQELSLLLRRARAGSGELSRSVHPDLDGSAYALLAAVVREDGLRARDVAALFGVDKGAISRQIGRLERLGLVTRTPDPEDRRALLLVATEEGRRRLGTAVEARRARFRRRLEDWSPQDVAALAELLGRYNAPQP